MFSRIVYTALRLSRRIWIRVALIAFLAVIAAALAPFAGPFIASSTAWEVNSETVLALLSVLINSMLTVTAFSLTIMVTGHLAADQHSSPRAHRILREDGATQTTLATFIGAFVYALTGYVLVQTGLVDAKAYAPLYLMTLAVIGLVVVTITRWIALLAALGSVEDTLERVNRTARSALTLRAKTPYLGGCPATSDTAPPDDACDVVADGAGFVQHIDIEEIGDAMTENGATFHLSAMPGDWVGPGDRLGAVSSSDLDDALERKLRHCFTLGDTRTYDQDAEFGVSVLTDIAERALSPSVNDPRTALDVIARLTLLFEDFEGEVVPDEVQVPNVVVPAIDLSRLLDTAFDPIARDGAGFVEVQLYLQTALARLTRHRVDQIAEAARILSGRALAHAEAGLGLEADLARVRAVAVAKRAAARRDR